MTQDLYRTGGLICEHLPVCICLGRCVCIVHFKEGLRSSNAETRVTLHCTPTNPERDDCLRCRIPWKRKISSLFRLSGSDKTQPPPPHPHLPANRHPLSSQTHTGTDAQQVLVTSNVHFCKQENNKISTAKKAFIYRPDRKQNKNEKKQSKNSGMWLYAELWRVEDFRFWVSRAV